MNRIELEERLINFSVLIIKLSQTISKSLSGNVLSSQLIRSGTSVSLNFGEAQRAESRKDFIHKQQIILKELNECYVCLKIIRSAGLYKSDNLIEQAIQENNELLSIFVKSIMTLKRNSSIKTKTNKPY